MPDVKFGNLLHGAINSNTVLMFEGRKKLDINNANLEGFGFSETLDDSDINVKITGRQKKFISNAMAEIFWSPRKSTRDKTDAVGIQRIIEGKTWTDEDRENAEKFVMTKTAKKPRRRKKQPKTDTLSGAV